MPTQRPATEANAATLPMPMPMAARARDDARTGPSRSGMRAPKMRTHEDEHAVDEEERPGILQADLVDVEGHEGGVAGEGEQPHEAARCPGSTAAGWRMPRRGGGDLDPAEVARDEARQQGRQAAAAPAAKAQTASGRDVVVERLADDRADGHAAVDRGREEARRPRPGGPTGARSWAAVAAPMKKPASPRPVIRRSTTSHQHRRDQAQRDDRDAGDRRPAGGHRPPAERRRPAVPAVGRTIAADTAKAPTTSPTSTPPPCEHVLDVAGEDRQHRADGHEVAQPGDGDQHEQRGDQPLLGLVPLLPLVHRHGHRRLETHLAIYSPPIANGRQ